MTAPTRRTAAAVGVLAAIAYLPALLSSPGRLPADTKLYLYLDPGGLIGRAASTFEPHQFAGWVPHQQITYLWPSGPWFWLFDTAGVPDWIAHRLWIGSLMFLAGWGVYWMARRLGLGGAAAFTAALLYQLSPFLLPYISRTSLLLLPWAGLGWIVGLTIGATARAAERQPAENWRGRLLPWREPALIALLVATVGSANATALALIAPAPVLWLLHAAWGRILPWREAIVVALRVGALCVVVSLWWMAMLVVQSRDGAPVLSFSETLSDVSRNSTGSEVLRGLGYWLFYIRDPYGPATSSSFDYLTRSALIAVSYLVTLVGLAGIAVTSSMFRRYAALLVVTGVVLSVGVHPIGSPSPLMSLVANDDDSGLALALRSSTRALPLLVLGVALGAGSLVAAIPPRPLFASRPRLPRMNIVAAGAIVLVVLVNLPSLWRLELVDEVIDRDQTPPTAWSEAAAALDTGDDGRVLQLPGAEFGAFRWGYTVDQPLVGLTERPLVTRDLLPLGSASAMDLLYALDDRFQEGTAEAAAVAPVARLLGADTLWIANDAEFERFRTPRPEVVNALLVDTAAHGLGPTSVYGEPFVSTPTVPMVDPSSLADERVGAPIEPVALVGVAEPLGVARAKDTVILVAGSGDGVVDAAAAGLVSGHELLLYAADSPAVDPETALIVTDSNRDRAHHWRGSQDVHGHTEPGGPDDDVLVPTNADQRLAVFDSDDAAIQTIAVQDGPVSAIASSYGEPFAYLPEHRAVMAIDGDPTTAWLVGGHGDPVGERIRLQVAGPGARSMTVTQPTPAPGGRRIESVRVTVDDAVSFETAISDASTTAKGQAIDLGTAATAVDIEILGVTVGDQARAASRSPVGFTEIDLGRGPTTELIRPPRAALDAATGPLTLLLNRLRIDPLNRWRADPEPELVRVFELPAERIFDATVTMRLDLRADDAQLAALVGAGADATASGHLTGAPRHGAAAAFDGDPATAWITPFDGAVGARLVTETAGTADGSTMAITQPPGDFATITALSVEAGGSGFEAVVPPPDATGTSMIELPHPFASGTVTITITQTDGATTVDRRFGDAVLLPAAIAELAGAGLPTVEGAEAASITDAACRSGLLEIDGRDVPVSFEATLGQLLDGDPVEATLCDGQLRLDAGEHRIASTGRASTGLTVDRVVLTDRSPPPAEASPIAVSVERGDTRARTLTVSGCVDGCWLVHGEGFNDAWSATVEGVSLGPPVAVDGGFNGWRLPPADKPVTVHVTWNAQTPVTLGLLLSGLGVLACLIVVALTRGRRPELEIAPPTTRWRRPAEPNRSAARSAVVLVVASTILISPIWGAISLAPAVGLVLLVRFTDVRAADRLLELIGWTSAAIVAAATIAIVRRNRPFPNAAWTEGVERLNGLAVFSVVCLAVGTLGWSARRSGEPRA